MESSQFAAASSTPVVASACPRKDLCGSCSWSAIPYEEQCSRKVIAVNEALSEHQAPLQVSRILPSPRQAHYRNRMDFVIDFEGRVGLRQKGKWWRVIDDHHCFISDERIQDTFSVVRNWVRSSGLSFFDRKKHHGLLRFAVIRASTLGEVLVNLITSVPQQDEEALIEEKLLSLASAEGITSLIWTTNSGIADVSFGEQRQVVKGSGYLNERVAGLNFRISPQSFFQTNSHTAGLLIETMRCWVKAARTERLIDLYCGTGFFSVALAGQGCEVHGVEVQEEAIIDARYNASINQAPIHEASANYPSISDASPDRVSTDSGVRNWHRPSFEVAPSEDFDWSSLAPDSVIVDPPRGGMHERALQQLLRALPQRIFYVSCNYRHFAKDCAALSSHYEPREALLIDQFPHTPHVELLCWLERRAASY